MRYIKLLILALLITAGMIPAAAQEETGAALRVVNLTPDASAIDVYVDGEPITDSISLFTISRRLTVDAGTHTISITLAGSGDAGRGLVPPVELDAAAGSSYIVSVIGQRRDDSLSALLIDETTVFDQANLDTTGEQIIILNALSDVPLINFYFEDELVIENLGFGDYRAVNFPQERINAFVTRPGVVNDEVIYEINGTYGLANNTSLLAIAGSYPDRYGPFVTNYSPLNVADYLAGYSRHGAVNFDIFSSLLDEAELSEMLRGEGQFTIFAPSDAILERLPERTLETLRQDPATLARVLRYHIVPERLTISDIAHRADEDGLVRLTTLQGSELTIFVGMGVFINNHVNVTSFDYEARNGIVHIIDNLLDLSGSAGNTIRLPLNESAVGA